MRLQFKNNLIRNINRIGVENFVKSSAPPGMEELLKFSFAIKTRDKQTCQVCGFNNSKADPRYLVAHHIIHKGTYPRLKLNPNNGITLCNVCERQTHGEGLEIQMQARLKIPELVTLLQNPRKKSILFNIISAWPRVMGI